MRLKGVQMPIALYKRASLTTGGKVSHFIGKNHCKVMPINLKRITDEEMGFLCDLKEKLTALVMAESISGKDFFSEDCIYAHNIIQDFLTNHMGKEAYQKLAIRCLDVNLRHQVTSELLKSVRSGIGRARRIITRVEGIE